jgi:hypothetical protein
VHVAWSPFAGFVCASKPNVALSSPDGAWIQPPPVTFPPVPTGTTPFDASNVYVKVLKAPSGAWSEKNPRTSAPSPVVVDEPVSR